ncbi:MAG: AraC family transcriptional regulator [Candidatus Dependentiae bacterium]|nr:AraC family transcriptional regulator [Candidatus Dependentiae bacterium]
MKKAYTYLAVRSLLGDLTAVYEDGILCFLGFGEKAAKEAAATWPEATYEDNHKVLWSLLSRLEDRAALGNLPLGGTPFQREVWVQLTKIPCGTVTTYQYIANQIGRPKAVRAVANAIGRNPISVFIPCHRVIGSDGKLHGYRWGVEIKEKLLARERESAQNAY